LLKNKGFLANKFRATSASSSLLKRVRLSKLKIALNLVYKKGDITPIKNSPKAKIFFENKANPLFFSKKIKIEKLATNTVRETVKKMAEAVTRETTPRTDLLI
ncbi:MAG: hypothetical protein M1514_01760, partial [Patescibacteria group bacterium]|nr:hypothetical protein [Patescibacteria group bacterium]